jgi:hypothetical protein
MALWFASGGVQKLVKVEAPKRLKSLYQVFDTRGTGNEFLPASMLNPGQCLTSPMFMATEAEIRALEADFLKSYNYRLQLKKFNILELDKVRYLLEM